VGCARAGGDAPAPIRRRHPALRLHQSRDVERTWRDGIPVTPPARTLLDLASVLDGRPLRRAVREAQALELVTAGELVKRLGQAVGRPAQTLARLAGAGAPAGRHD
jgi:hypothetical protein